MPNTPPPPAVSASHTAPLDSRRGPKPRHWSKAKTELPPEVLSTVDKAAARLRCPSRAEFLRRATFAYLLAHGYPAPSLTSTPGAAAVAG